MVQEGNDLVRMEGVRGEVDDGSGQAFGHREIAGLKLPALQTGLNRMQGGTEPIAQGHPGLFGRRLEGWKIGGDQLKFTDSCFELKSVKKCILLICALSRSGVPKTGIRGQTSWMVSLGPVNARRS